MSSSAERLPSASDVLRPFEPFCQAPFELDTCADRQIQPSPDRKLQSRGYVAGNLAEFAGHLERAAVETQLWHYFGDQTYK